MQRQSLFETKHVDYEAGVRGVTLVNDCIAGQQEINEGERWEDYLPNLSSDPNSERSKQNHALMRKLAQFTNIPKKTLLKLAGCLVSANKIFDLPAEISYMEDNIDGCGNSADEFVRLLANYILKEKYVGVLSMFNGDTSEGDITKGELESLGYKSYLRIYSRSSILDYDFTVYSGVSKLSFVKLLQITSRIDHSTYERVEDKSLLILGLDDQGRYYQREVVINEDGHEELSDLIYITANGNYLNDIPFEFISDDSSNCGVPEDQGYIYPIANKCVERYRALAVLQLVMVWTAFPMITSSGWDDKSYKLFEEYNGGSIGVGPGASMQLPIQGDISLLQMDGKSDINLAFLTQNKKEIQALGGAMPDDETADETVGVAKIRNADALVVLSGIAESIEKSLTSLLAYSQMFMSGGDYSTDGVVVSIGRDFDNPKLAPANVKEILNLYDNSIWDVEEVINALYSGGWGDTKPEDLINRLQTNV